MTTKKAAPASSINPIEPRKRIESVVTSHEIRSNPGARHKPLSEVVENFVELDVEQSISMTLTSWRAALMAAEVGDNQQKVNARPYLAWGVGLLLIVQNVGIWFIVVWALNKDELGKLQIIFSTLIAGTLAQSYLLLRLITEKVFGDINYHVKEDD